MKKTLYADISLLLVALIWGATFVVVQNAIGHLEPFSFNAIRFSLASILLSIWYVLKNKKIPSVINLKLIIAGIKVGTWLFLGYALQTIGLLNTSPAKAGFITGLSIVIVPIISLFILKQKPSRNAIYGVITATIGLYLMTMLGESDFTLYDLLILIGSFCFAMHIIMNGKYANNFPTLSLTIIQITIVAFFSLISGFLFEDVGSNFNLSTLFEFDVWLALFITGFFATAIAFLAQTYFQQYTSPTRVALAFATEPVFAAITSFIWINEHLTAYSITGCILIFIGMILAELPVGKGKKSQSLSNLSN